MYTTAYHEVLEKDVVSILKGGLKCSSRGDKANDEFIIQTDKLLDEQCPKKIKKAGVSRRNNIYCYLGLNHRAIDITDGKIKPPAEISQSPKHKLLKVLVDPKLCFVSDLDLYDQLLNSVKQKRLVESQDYIKIYWQKLTPLIYYDQARGFKRPEIMVTYDLPISRIEVVKS
jgi:hypothetical protein